MKSHEYLRVFEMIETLHDASNIPIFQQFQHVYRNAPQIVRHQSQRCRELVNAHQAIYGTQDILCARAPGRVDLLGSHTEPKNSFDKQGSISAYLSVRLVRAQVWYHSKQL